MPSSNELPRWLRIALAVVSVPAAIVAGGAVAAWADVPNAFKAGDTLSADKLNANFKDVDARLAHLVVTKNGKKYSLGATYCGATNATNGQITNGFAGAKGLCENVAACGPSPSAHTCTPDEIMRSAQLGIALPVTGWITGGFSAPTSPPPRDCNGFTVSSAANNGAIWNNSGFVDVEGCSTMHPVLCCD